MLSCINCISVSSVQTRDSFKRNSPTEGAISPVVAVHGGNCCTSQSFTGHFQSGRRSFLWQAVEQRCAVASLHLGAYRHALGLGLWLAGKSESHSESLCVLKCHVRLSHNPCQETSSSQEHQPSPFPEGAAIGAEALVSPRSSGWEIPHALLRYLMLLLLALGQHDFSVASGWKHLMSHCLKIY